MTVIEIPLTQGKVALVDAEDAERVQRYTWHAHRAPRDHWYALSRVAGRKVSLQQFLFAPQPPYVVSFVNGNGLDCRRANVRLATPSQSGLHCRLRRSNRSGYRNVGWDAQRQRWRAVGYADGKTVHLGYFACAEDAARAADAYQRAQHGAWAQLNFPDQ